MLALDGAGNVGEASAAQVGLDRDMRCPQKTEEAVHFSVVVWLIHSRDLTYVRVAPEQVVGLDTDMRFPPQNWVICDFFSGELA